MPTRLFDRHHTTLNRSRKRQLGKKRTAFLRIIKTIKSGSRESQYHATKGWRKYRA